nr:hypothetical protein [Acidobacteriota bacterium]
MSTVTVELPAWARGMCGWVVYAAGREGRPGVPIETTPGRLAVRLTAEFATATVSLRGEIRVELDVPRGAAVTLRP